MAKSVTKVKFEEDLPGEIHSQKTFMFKRKIALERYFYTKPEQAPDFSTPPKAKSPNLSPSPPAALESRIKL